MKYNTDLKFRFFFGLIFLFLGTSLQAEVRKGSMGDNVAYQWDTETGQVTISGQGAMYNYDNYETVSPLYNPDIKAVIIEEGVTSIGSYAFYQCSSLTSVEIPASVTSIGDHAFYYCSNLAALEIPESITSIEAWTFYYCSHLTEIKLPASVTAIGDQAFYFCKSLTSIELPSRVSYIGDRAFSSCTALSSITVGNTPAAIRANTFENVDKAQCVLYVPTGSEDTYQRTYYWKEFVNIQDKNLDAAAKYIEFILKQN